VSSASSDLRPQAGVDGPQALVSGARAFGVALEERQLASFSAFHRELLDWNERFNLTAITDVEGVYVRHFLDSLSCLKALPRPEQPGSVRVIDVGAGAGFPGIPIKIAEPWIHVTLLEATGKKVRFLEHLVQVLALDQIGVVQARAEELGSSPQHREQFDWAIARAVAEMPVLAEYLLPLVRVGGVVLAQKGERAAAEVQGAATAIETLGGRVRRLVPVELRGLAETRYLVIIDKIAATPDRYPRRPGVPSKRPLR
jgi:16S rRNA (guanine527-N7)-methyltransferase